MRWMGLLAVVVGGCVGSSTFVCERGTEFERTCPGGATCDDVHHLCVTKDQLTCTGLANGASCMIRDTPGFCQDEVCFEAKCGDGFMRGDEQCDGADFGGRTCLDLGYYDPSPLVCNSACALVTTQCLGYCGDGMIEPGKELCDGQPPQQSCVDLGYGAGLLGCNMCGPDQTDCKFFGWETPHFVAGAGVNAVHGTADDNIYVAGNYVIDHFDGTSWSNVDIAGCADDKFMFGVWTFGAGDMIAVTLDGLEVRVTSSGCAKSTIDPAGGVLQDVWASGPTDIFAVGTNGIFHYNGTSWTNQSGTQVRRVWGRGPSDVYAGGGYPGSAISTLLHYDGSSWSAVTGFTIDEIDAIWGDATSLYVGGAYNGGATVLRFKSSTWTTIMQGFPDRIYAGTIAGGRVLAFGKGSNIDGATGTPYADLFAYDETTSTPGWATMRAPATASQDDHRVWASPTGKVRMIEAGGQKVYHYQGQIVIEDGDAGTEILGMKMRSPTEAHAIGINSTINFYDWNGSTWAKDVSSGAPSSSSGASPQDFWQDAAGSVYVAQSSGPIRKRVAGVWSNATGANPMPGSKIWGASGSDLWASELVYDGVSMSNYSRLRHWNGSTVDALCGTCTTAAPNYIAGMWGSSSTDIFAVGGGGMILHWNGNTWATMTSGTTKLLYAVWGSGPTDVYAVGNQGAAVHYDGSTWQDISLTVNPVLLDTVWGRGPKDVFAGGSSGTVLHYNGTHWSPIRSGADGDIYGLSGSGDTLIYAAFNLAGSTREFRLLRTIDW